MPINHQETLKIVYEKVATLDFGSLLLLSAQLNDHIFNCWQHHQLQIEKAREATRPVEQALPPDETIQ